MPCRYLYRDRTLLFECDIVADGTIQQVVLRERGYRHIIAFQRIDDCDMVVEVLIAGQLAVSVIRQLCPARIYSDLFHAVFSGIDRLVVQLYDRIALLAVRLLREGLHQLQRSLQRHDLLIQRKERGLQDRIRTASHADLLRDLGRVDDVQLSVLLRQLRLHAVRHMMHDLLLGERRIQQEGTSVLQVAHHVILEHVCVQRAGDEVCIVDVVCRADRRLAETQVRTGNAAGLLGIICEVSLCVLIRVVTDDLDRGLVRGNRTIRTQAPEQAGSVVSLDLEAFVCRQAQVRHIILDADRESVDHLVFLQVIEYGLDMARLRILGSQTVTSADDLDILVILKRRNDIQVQRVAHCTGLFGAVQNSDLLYGGRHDLQHVFRSERTIQVNLDHSDFFALCHQRIDRLVRGLSDRTHGDDDALGIRCAIVSERSVMTSGNLRNLFHIFRYDGRNLGIMLVARLHSLEVDIIVLSTAARYRVGMRVQRALAISFQRIVIDQILI